METRGINKQVKLRATLFGSGCGANLTMPESRFQELVAQNLLSYRATSIKIFNNMWFNGKSRQFDLLVMEYGKENQ